MENVFLHVSDAVAQLSQFLSGGSRLHAENRIRRFCRREMMRPGAYAADASRDARHFFNRSAHAEFFKAAQFDHVDARIGDITTIIKLNRDLRMSLDSTHGLNYKCLSHGYFLAFFACSRPAPAKRLNVAARSGICLGSRPMVESAPIISTIGLASRLRGP